MPLLSDDVAAIRFGRNGWQVAPGRSRIRVTPESADALGARFDGLAPVWDERQPRPAKRFFAAAPSPAGETTILRAIVVLARAGTADAPQLHLSPALDLLHKLVINRHMSHTLGRAEHERDFTRLGQLVQQVRGYELRRPDSLPMVSSAATTLIGALSLPDD